MHELSVVMGIVDLAEKKAREHHAEKISRIDLEIGVLAGIEYDALEFVWDAGVKSSLLEGANKVIHKIPGKGKCLECDTEFEMNHLFDECPSCKGYFNEIISGKELRVKSLIIN